MDANFPVPLLLLPGLICDARIFADVRRRLPTTTIVADYRSADTIASMATAALDGAPARFAVLGHSMGGRVALEIFRQAGDRVAGLALVSTGIHPPAPGEAMGRHALRDIGRREGMAALVDAWLPPMVAPARSTDAALMVPLRAMCIDAGLARFEAQIAALLDRPDAESVLASIDCPTLVAAGSADAWSPPSQHETIAARIPGARLVIVEGAGHMLPAEAPAELGAAITAWLSDIDTNETKERRT